MGKTPYVTTNDEGTIKIAKRIEPKKWWVELGSPRQIVERELVTTFKPRIVHGNQNGNENFVFIPISSWIWMNFVIPILIFWCILKCKVGIIICYIIIMEKEINWQ